MKKTFYTGLMVKFRVDPYINVFARLTEWHRLEPKCNIEIIFSSPGGSIIDGFELFDHIQHLRNEGHHVTTGSLGYAASMAGILLQSGDTRWIGHQAWMMIHRAAFWSLW